MEPATCSKKPLESTSPRRSPTRCPSPPTRLSLDVDDSTHPPSTCYEDAHAADPSSPKSTHPCRFSIGHKHKHKNGASIDSIHSAASHDSYSTANEHHGEEEEDKHGILHKVATGMQKARPYVERLSGTYEPLPIDEPERTK
ncbi:hypothetical protein B5807_08557 [Epicoccum nigrum]|uniref:Uncharacterized protein n=1 Tax=Epicoccum nigrum TaxID=105696 RepID=A0A1Y2LR74_EPING|nr:hypothetical protein B5807_08557 [Epicoccum nigrum]